MSKREKLANVAKEEASKCFHGNVMTIESNLKPITTLFSGYTVGKFDGLWCAAFVYYCCIKTGFNIPVKYPNEKLNIIFAGCIDWEMWANLPENKFYYSREDIDFLPDKGDIVIYDKVFCDAPYDHIGIVIENRKDSIIVAEGNINNVSGVVERKKNIHIRGYIRIPNDYDFKE